VKTDFNWCFFLVSGPADDGWSIYDDNDYDDNFGLGLDYSQPLWSATNYEIVVVEQPELNMVSC
jgi:hypothetical protein